MSVIPLHGSDTDSETRALLRFMLAHGDIVGTDHAGRTVLQLAVDQWTLHQLCAFDAGSEDLEDADAEPEPDEMDSAPVVLDVVRAKRALVTRCLRAVAVAFLPARDYARGRYACGSGAGGDAADQHCGDCHTVLPHVPQGAALRRRLHQRREAVQEGPGLCLLGCERNGARVAQMSDTPPLDLNSNPLGIGRQVSGIADPDRDAGLAAGAGCAA